MKAQHTTKGLTMKRALILGVLLLLAGCDNKDWGAAGYQDGYAVGYNTTCGYPGNLIHGRWDDSTYSSAYSSGMQAGISACNNERKAK